MVQKKKLKICFNAMDGIGHIAACVGVLQPLVARGHDVFFILNETFAGKVAKYAEGVREIYVKKSPSPEGENMSKAVDIGKKMIACGFVSGKSSAEKLNIWEQVGFHRHLGEALLEFDPLIKNIIDEEKPDLLIVDNFMIPAAYVVSGIPYAVIHSCSPLYIYNDNRLPPPFCGMPTKGWDPDAVEEFKKSLQIFFDSLRVYQKQALKNVGLDIDYETYVLMSPYLNIYAYPKELDYTDLVPPPKNSFRIDAFSRDASKEEIESFVLPDDFLNRSPGVGLIYFSMGSMGGADAELIQKYVSWFKESPHKFIVSKGSRGDEFELDAANCYSGNFLPQTALLPIVDLVITHGGNNSTTETFFVGKPMIVLPLFIDQYDNARRIEECNFGVQFNPYEVTKKQMLEAINKILASDDIKTRLAAARERIVRDEAKERLADALEHLAINKQIEH